MSAMSAWTTILLVLAGLPGALHSAPPRFVLAENPATLQLSASQESSGLAMAHCRPGLFWIANDGGSGPELYLAGTEGSYQGTLRINGALNADWEDLDSFAWNGRPWLLVADVGDNNALRNFCTIYLLPEPAIPSTGQISETRPAQKIVFRYEDGPRDCEAVAADPAGGTIQLISKRTNPPALYELPLLPEASGWPLIAKRTGTVHVERPPEAPMVPYGNQPTGLAISPDGSLAAVLTYYGVFLFPRQKDESWAAAFSKKPEVLQPHRQKQAEAIAFSLDGKTLYVLSEGTNPPIITYHAQ